MKQSLCAGPAPCRAHERAGHMAARTSRAVGSLWRSVGTLSLQLPQKLTVISPTHDLHVLLSHTKHRKARQPDSLRNHSLSCPLFEPQFHAELASILPHLAVLWSLASVCSLCPQTGRMKEYLHMVSAASAGGKGGALGTAPRGIASWLLP